MSKRRGHLWCGFLGERVTIAGQAILYMKGTYSLS
ncbi:hypothetical protein SAMN05444410_1012 [Hydrobacter penzbergensis]|uniref:Uncharacterized protein n=1 Tax=Hydrobacter penzbergensis TaxID=1235997 RepID=A0A8X8ICA8_9BACT|nr:hypothetical protein SAMN05444410_1012 [Hydrobacter penzbergensis]